LGAGCANTGACRYHTARLGDTSALRKLSLWIMALSENLLGKKHILVFFKKSACDVIMNVDEHIRRK